MNNELKSKLKKIGPCEYEIPLGFVKEMILPAKLFLNDMLLSLIDQNAIEQLANISTIKGLGFPPIGLPDIHLGYGVPVGSVAGFEKNNGIVSAGMVGFDINCGISLIKTNIKKDEISNKLDSLGKYLASKIPVGVGSKSNISLSTKELDSLLETGALWALKNKIATKSEIEKIEDFGTFKGANPKNVSSDAKSRGMKQLGTLGSGNHFVELSFVKDTFSITAKTKYNLDKNTLCIMIHTGSRGLGHQIATEFVKLHFEASKKYGLSFKDKQISGVPTNSIEAKNYLSAMACAANYSYVNKLFLISKIREALCAFFKISSEELGLEHIYTLSHNICKLEKHNEKELYVHRKGATKAFPMTPVIIAGSMGTSSFLLEGTKTALEKSLGSSCHGSGRSLSRAQAIKSFKYSNVIKELHKSNIRVFSPSKEGIIDESPGAYKPIYPVIETIENAKLSKKIAEFFPMIVIKG
jgi:tRNA-splicing ligase RtcB